MNSDLFDQAVDILARNDKGTYTVPTHGLYPFQWNWDSALSAIGLNYINEPRAWTEIETLFSHQWEDGMVPHIIFHQEDDGYFPGPEVWQTGRPVPTSGITQPPVAAFALRRLFNRAKDKEAARTRAAALLPKIAAWHDWFFANRDPEQTGLVAIIHPWESGRDNSIDWDDAFSRVPTEGVGAFTRRDTLHTDPAHRPTQEQYQRYIWLVERFRSLGWDNSKLHEASPFRVVDPGFNAILLRSCADLADMADDLGETALAETSRARVAKGIAALEAHWSDKYKQYLCYDRAIGALIDSPSIGGLLPVFAPIPEERATAIAARLETLGNRVKYLVPSHDPDVEDFDGRRYWRGPAWLIVNYMIADGLARDGYDQVAARVVSDSVELIRIGGFAEYFDPMNGAPCGGPHFTWTAAMVMEFLKMTGEPA
ncbi:amylo-alpha-1,6-glucosidase [Cognatishimia maritima]|uniref:Trehalase n=1 Tax=Cognatishimia maritima TaxID=870908 RepID=A0A1M5K205_9RHOB|nr:trehalase family glycosidase [Cognatishimia maritima]SHG46882.1 Trehalase [Cognatishimia maritima]